MENDTHHDSHLSAALVADDEPLLRMDTADLVAEERFSVAEARTAEEASEFLKGDQWPQLWVTDIQPEDQ